MLSLPSFLAFLLPAPALRDRPATAPGPAGRRRAVSALNLPDHLLRDVGLDDHDQAANDPRWVRQFELDR